VLSVTRVAWLISLHHAEQFADEAFEAAASGNPPYVWQPLAAGGTMTTDEGRRFAVITGGSSGMTK
jgi:hypothetical protein